MLRPGRQSAAGDTKNQCVVFLSPSSDNACRQLGEKVRVDETEREARSGQRLEPLARGDFVRRFGESFEECDFRVSGRKPEGIRIDLAARGGRLNPHAIVQIELATKVFSVAAIQSLVD